MKIIIILERLKIQTTKNSENNNKNNNNKHFTKLIANSNKKN